MSVPEGSPYDPKPRRTGAWVKAPMPIYRDGHYQVWFYTARPERYEFEDMWIVPDHLGEDDDYARV